MKSSKGSAFERDLCRRLSLWWTHEKRDDVFWRSAGSGARAKTRSKSGGKTYGQYGDIQTVDPIGSPLTQLCTIELKRGYTKSTFADAIEKPEKAAQQMFESFLEQADTDHHNAGTPHWMLITKRDKKLEMVFLPVAFYLLLKEAVPEVAKATPYSKFRIQSKLKSSTKIKTRHVWGCPLSVFLHLVTPEVIIFLYKQHRKNENRKG